MRINLVLQSSLGRGRGYRSKALVLYFMNRDKIVTVTSPFSLLVLSFTMSDRGRSRSPKPLHDVDVDMEHGDDKKDAKAVVVNGLSRNVAHTHIQTIFGFYGEIVKIDLPLYTKCMVHVSFAGIPVSHALFSWSKSRQGCSGVCRSVVSTKGCIPHERRSTGRSHFESGTLRRSHPHSLPLPPTSRAQRAGPQVFYPFSLSFAYTFSTTTTTQARIRASALCRFIPASKRLWPPWSSSERHLPSFSFSFALTSKAWRPPSAKTKITKLRTRRYRGREGAAQPLQELLSAV